MAALLSLFCSALIAEESEFNYKHHPKAKAFVKKMESQHGFDPAFVYDLLQDAKRKQSIIDAISRPAEKTLNWARYRKIFLTEKRISQGREFMRDNQVALERAQRDFGVPAEIIAAIIGVETSYGKIKGSYRVLDSLATLGFDYPPRGKFFLSELEQYLLLVKEQRFDAKTVKGSYAGAMGYGQFISSSYRHYAIDFDGDGVADIVNNVVDAIGSVANYFKSHGWNPGATIAVTAQAGNGYDQTIANKKLKPKYTVDELASRGYIATAPVDPEQLATAMVLAGESGDEYWLGLKNFYVITRYNHSHLYAMAVFQLSEELAVSELSKEKLATDTELLNRGVSGEVAGG